MKKYIFGLILFGAIIFRILLAPTAIHQDLLSQAGWGEYIFEKGPKGFYSEGVWIYSWPNHPPLTSLYYGYSYKLYSKLSLRLHQSVLLLKKAGINEGKYHDFVDSFDKIVSPEKAYPLGFLISLKIFPIFFDILIGCLIFYLAKNINKNPAKYMLIYYLSPFSWYISCLWGQTDQISCFLTLASFWLLTSRPLISILLFFIGASIKPTSVFLLPLFLFIIIKSKINFREILLAGIICLLINYFIFAPFTDTNLISFTFNSLLPRIFDRPPRLTTNAYNFWHIFSLNRDWSDQTHFLFIPANVWSGLLYIAINYIAFKIVQVKNKGSIVAAIFIVSFGSWLFMTNMLDRYSFVGIVAGLILSIYNYKIFKYWLLLSFIYWLNLFRGWWFPEFLWPLKYLLTTNNYLAGLFLSIGNVAAYIRIIQLLFENNFWPVQVIKNKR